MSIAYKLNDGISFTAFSQQLSFGTKKIEIISSNEASRVLAITGYDDGIKSIIYPTIRIKLEALGLNLFSTHAYNPDY
jgi:hypothetical protein